MATTTTPRRMTREARREHFLDAAAALVEDRGIDAVTMEGVAAEAGVSKALGYAYFENRTDILMALLERELAVYRTRARARMEAATDFEGRLRAAVGSWFDMVAERGHLLGTLLQASQVQAALKPQRSTFHRRLEEFYGHMAAEELGVPEKKATVAAAILIAGLAGVVERWVECGESRTFLEETFVQVALGAMQNLG